MTFDIAAAAQERRAAQRALADKLMAVPRDENGPLAVPVQPPAVVADNAIQTPGSAHALPDWVGRDQDETPDTAPAEQPAEPVAPQRPTMKENPAQGRSAWASVPMRKPSDAKLDLLLAGTRHVDPYQAGV